MSDRIRTRTRFLGFASLLAGLAFTAACLEEPPLEERWTYLEIVDATPTDAAQYSVGGTTPVAVSGRITYRELLTGFLVADLRATDVFTTDDTNFEREDLQDMQYLDRAREVDLVLQNSISLGFDAVPITGFDHLIQDVTFSFDAGAIQPFQQVDTTATYAATGLFLLLYFSDDVQEVELSNGQEVEVVTPTFSDERDILSMGIELVPQPPTP